MQFSVLAICCLVVGGSEYRFPAGVPLDARQVVFYAATDHYQFVSEVSYGVHDRRRNISANRAEKYGNANREFPWRTGGLDDCPNGTSFKFYRLPADRRIDWWTDRGWSKSLTIGRMSHVIEQRPGLIRWRYPDGTIVGEVLQVDGRTFEVRTMEKAKGEWKFKVYRPWERLPDKPSKSTSMRLHDTHPVTVFDARRDVAETDLPKSRVDAILGSPFRDVTDSGECPTAAKRGQIVPVNYQGAFITAESCVKCHSTAGKSANEFQPGRDWYGTVRGSDSVFSLSVFDPSCASRNGISRRPVLRGDLPLARGRE